MSFMFINKEKGLRAETNVDTQRISLIWTSAICNLPLAISTNSYHFQRQSELYVRILTNQTIQWKSYYIALAVSRMCLVCTWYVLEQYLESQTMLHRWDLGRPGTSKNIKCSRPDRQMNDTDNSDGWFRNPWHHINCPYMNEHVLF